MKNQLQKYSLRSELAVCLPLSKVKLERLFLMLKHIKRDTQATLGVNQVENLMKILQERPPLVYFDLTNAMKL